MVAVARDRILGLMTKRFVQNGIYAFSMLLIVFMRIAVSLGMLSSFSPLLSDAVWSTIVQCAIMGVVPFFSYFLYLKLKKDKHALSTIAREFKYDCLPDKKSWVFVLFISLIATYLVTCLSNVWYTLIRFVGYTPAISETLVYDKGVLAADVALTAMLPAIFEEFTNRGLLYGANENVKFPTFQIFLTAIAFALMHTNVTQVFYTFFFGLITGALVYVTKSIYPAMFCHFVNNFVAVMRSYARQTGKGFVFLNKAYDFLLGTTTGGIVATVIFIAAAFIMLVLFLKMSVVESDRRILKNREVCFEKEEISRFDYAPLCFAMTLNATVTIFTFVWGMMR